MRIELFGLLVSLVLVSAGQQGVAVAAETTELPTSAEDTSPMQVGSRAPAFSVRTVEGEPYQFDPEKLERPTILISFRGGWCPYCNMHLMELRHVIPEIRQAGFDILFLSNDRPDQLYESLAKETQEEIDGLDYLILSDADINAARAFGTAFVLPNGRRGQLGELGIDYENSSIGKYNVLAVPSVFLINQSGEIAFVYANPDYKIRLSVAELKKTADELLEN